MIGVEQKNSELLFIEPQAERLLTRQIDGGAAHGLSNAYLTAIEVMEDVDKMAFDLITSVNTIHKRGLTMEGEAGGDFFQSLRLDLTASAVNTGDASATVRSLTRTPITPQRSNSIMMRARISGAVLPRMVRLLSRS